jgi:Transposase
VVASVTVAHPLLVKLITSARVKTDARETLHLARLLAAGLIPAVWIPPQDVRELRALVAHHTRLIRHRTQAKNRLRSTLHRYNIAPPDGGLFTPAQRSWWEALSLSAVEKLRIRQDLSLLESLEPLIAEVEVELTRLSGSPRASARRKPLWRSPASCWSWSGMCSPSRRLIGMPIKQWLSGRLWNGRATNRRRRDTASRASNLCGASSIG